MTKLNYEKRLYIIFLSLSFTFIFIFMGVYIYFIMKQEANEYENTMERTIIDNVSSSQIKWEIIRSSVEEVMVGKEVYEWANWSNYNDFYFYAKQVQQSMRKATLGLSHFDFSIAVMHPNNGGFVITPTSSESYEYYIKETLGASNKELEVINKFINKNILEKVIQIDDKICYMKKRTYLDKELIYFISFYIDDFLNSSDKYNWYLRNSEGVFATNDEFFDENNLIFETISEENIGSKIITDNHILYVYGYDGIEWMFIGMLDNPKLFIPKIIFKIIIPLLILLIISFALAKLIAKWMYRPVEEVINERDVLHEQRILRDLIYGAVVQENFVPEIFKSCLYKGILIEFCDLTLKNPIHLYHEEDYREVKEKIYNKIKELNGAKYININCKTCMLIVREELFEEHKNNLKNLADILIEKMNIRLFMSVSEVQKGIKGFKICFDQCSELMEYRFLFRTQMFVTMDQLELVKRNNYYYPMSTENQLIHLCINGDKHGIEVLRELYLKNKVEEWADPNSLRRFVFALSGTISRVLQEIKANEVDVFQDKQYISNLSSRWKEKDIFIVIEEAFSKIIDYVNKVKEKSDSSMMKKMINFIKENYNDDIMLVDLAEELHISEKYCGILFKKEVGQNYKSYLNHYRIEKAKEKLYKDPNIKILDLAKEVGFNSSNTFIRVFSKEIGMTPKVFIEKNILCGKKRQLQRMP